ncbi:hypothetical protein SLS62_009048 [Diatrype stigma]|uniref:Uncharacterized protein n=1 Tax=Diatrype stigma TaxID=117547 RepID=A0AAN9UH62_9PEZI
MDANTTGDISTRIAALHLAARRLMQGESASQPTRAELGMALELADLAAELAQQHQGEAQGREQTASECGRMQALCYDLLADMYSSVEEFEHKTYDKGKARAHDTEATSVTSPAASSSSGSSGRRTVRFSDQNVPQERRGSASTRGVLELPIRVRDNSGNGECGNSSSLPVRANAEERRPRRVLRRQKGQRFDVWKCF